MKKILIVSFICVLVDQIIKNVVLYNLDMGESISVINNFFALTFLENSGAAFSILTKNTILLILVGVVALNLIYFWLIKGKNIKKFETIIYGMLIGGIVGNMIDRIMHGYVIDYLDFNFINFPVFNFADILIVVSIFIIIIQMIKGDKNETHSK